MLSDDELILQIRKNNLEALELLFFKYENYFIFLIKKMGIYLKSLNYEYDDLKMIMKANMLEIIKSYNIDKSTFLSFWILMEKRHLIKIYRENVVELKTSSNVTSLDSEQTDYLLNKYLVETPLHGYIMKDEYNMAIEKIENNIGDFYKNILLLWGNGYSYSEIAEIYHTSTSHINNSIQKCFNLLKRKK